MSGNRKFLIIGSGFSKGLGFPTTKEIESFISILCRKDCSIDDRISEIDKKILKLDDIFKQDIKDTLIVLMDDDGMRGLKEIEQKRNKKINEYINGYKRAVKSVNEDKLRKHIESLGESYSWETFKSLYQTFKSDEEIDFSITDMLTIMQKLITDRISLNTRDIFENENKGGVKRDFYDFISAMNAYKLLMFKIFKNIFRMKRKINDSEVKNYRRIFEHILDNEIKSQTDIYSIRDLKDTEKRDFYLMNTGIYTPNWDGILPFLVMRINLDINNELISTGNIEDRKLNVYIDMGMPISICNLSNGNMSFSFAEETASSVNIIAREHPYVSKYITRIIKLFPIHGQFNIRICPRCQNPFMFIPDSIGNIALSNLYRNFVIDPLPNEEDFNFYRDYKLSEEAYFIGEPDYLKCPRCNYNTYFKDSYLEIQSILKPRIDNVLNKIYFEYADFFGNSDHIISIGYSFPRDDFVENYHLKIMSIKGDRVNRPNISVILYNKSMQDKEWYSLNEAEKRLKSNYEDNADNLETINVLKKITNKNKVRISFMGFPGILKRVGKNINEIMEFEAIE